MPRYWLGPWEWNSSGPSGGWQQPAAAVAAIDLRSRSQCAATVTPQGDGLFVTANAADLGSDYTDLGTDPDITFGAGRRAAWQSRFALPQALEAQSLREAVWETLTIQADPLGEDRCGPIVPTNAREFELWLAGQRIFNRRFAADRLEWAPVVDMLKRQYRALRQRCLDGELPPLFYRKVLGYWVRKYGLPYRQFQPADVPDESDVQPETTYTDDFNRADGEIGANWTEDGDIDIASNQAQHVSAGSFGIARARYNSDLSSDDHYSQIKAVTTFIGDAQSGAVARYSTSVNDLYYVTFLPTGTQIELWKVVGGSFTKIDSDSSGLIVNNVYRISCDGSTIKAIKNGSEELSVTDTSVVGNLRAGFMTYKGTGSTPIVDDWEASDLTPPSGPFPHYVRRALLGGMPIGGGVC